MDEKWLRITVRAHESTSAADWEGMLRRKLAEDELTVLSVEEVTDQAEIDQAENAYSER